MLPAAKGRCDVTADMEAAIRTLRDRQEIADLLARYCRGIDRLDTELIASVYHPDATDNHGIYKGNVKGFVEFIPTVLRQFSKTMHFLGNSLVEIDGDRAWAETYCMTHSRIDRPDGTQADRSGGVRYVDVIERRNGGTVAHSEPDGRV